MLERRATLGRLRSINPNMIHHFASQSQNCQLLKIKMLNGPARHNHVVISASPCAFFAPHGKDYFWKKKKEIEYNKHWKEIGKTVASQVELTGINFKFEALIFQIQIITYIIFHSIIRQDNVATWFSVLPIDIENLYRLPRGLYQYIYIYI